MKIRVLCIGKRMPKWVDAGVEDFLKRFTRQFPVSLDVVDATARTGGATQAQLQEADSNKLLAKIRDDDCVVALDERGKARDTKAFAAMIERWQLDGRDVVLLIGGADGHSDAMRERADALLSLSPMTMPHGLARLVLMEQLYRAWTLQSGHPYHRE